MEDYIDVDVGRAIKIDPVYLVEERVDFLIIGDIISKEISRLENQNWLLKYGEITNNNNFIIKAMSGFYITPSDIKIEPLWVESLQENINDETIPNVFFSITWYEYWVDELLKSK